MKRENVIPPDRPQLTADELQQLRWLLGGVLTVLAIATVAYMDVNTWGLMPLAMGASIATTFWPTLPARIPRLFQVLAFPFIAAFFAIDLWLRSELLPATIRLDILLLLYRALVYRQRRDDLQVVVLGLFLVVVAGVVTVSLAFAVQILVYTTCALLFLLTVTLGENARGPSAGGRTAASGATGSGMAPGWALHANWRRLFRRTASVADWRVFALGSGLFVGLIAVTALLFLLIPRFQLENGMFLERFMTRQARSGFTDSIRFGDVTEIKEDTSVALHVDVSDPGQIPATPYWRMLVLNQYEDGTFRMSADLRKAVFGRVQTSRWARPVNVPPRSSGAVWTFYLESGVSRYLPLLNPSAWLRFSEAQSFQVSDDLSLLALRKDPVTITAYQVGGFGLSSRLTDSPRDYYSGLIAAGAPHSAADNAILRRLVQEAVGPAQLGTAAFAARLCAWLRDRHPYSLSPKIPAGEGDPLVRWADSHEQGHCELFAGAFVLLARAAGYPARLVTGFRGGSWNGFINSSFMVRNSDAHAWGEIFDRASGSWLRADPLEIATTTQTETAASRLAEARMDRSWSARLDSLRVFWYRRVVNFDEQAQVRTFQAVKDATQATAHQIALRIDAAIARFRAWFRTPWDGGRIASFVTLTLAAAILTWAWRWLRLAVLQHLFFWRKHRREDPIRREAGRWLRRVVDAAPPGAERVTAELQRLRFGARETWPEAAVVFRRARLALRRRNRAAAPMARSE